MTDTRDKMIEEMAKLMAYTGRQSNDFVVVAQDFWAYTCDSKKTAWRAIAAAVLELVKPKRLVWVDVSTYGGKAYDAIAHNRAYRVVPKDGGEVYLTDHECGGFFATLEDAQAAAQAHADAAHWANTPLGKLVGVA